MAKRFLKFIGIVVAGVCIVFLLHLIRQTSFVTINCEVARINDSSIIVKKPNGKTFPFKCSSPKDYKKNERVYVKFDVQNECIEDDDIVIDVWK